MRDRRRTRGGDRRRVFRRSVLTLAGIALAPLGIAGAGQSAVGRRYPVFEPSHLETAMKGTGKSFLRAGESLAQDDPKTAKLQYLHAREQLAPTMTFWRQRKKDDAVKLLRGALAKLDDLDTALSTDRADLAAVKALAAAAGAACQACHSVYREQDPATKEFRLKPGSADE